MTDHLNPPAKKAFGELARVLQEVYHRPCVYNPADDSGFRELAADVERILDLTSKALCAYVKQSSACTASILEDDLERVKNYVVPELEQYADNIEDEEKPVYSAKLDEWI